MFNEAENVQRNADTAAKYLRLLSNIQDVRDILERSEDLISDNEDDEPNQNRNLDYRVDMKIDMLNIIRIVKHIFLIATRLIDESQNPCVISEIARINRNLVIAADVIGEQPGQDEDFNRPAAIASVLIAVRRLITLKLDHLITHRSRNMFEIMTYAVLSGVHCHIRENMVTNQLMDEIERASALPQFNGRLGIDSDGESDVDSIFDHSTDEEVEAVDMPQYDIDPYTSTDTDADDVCCLCHDKLTEITEPLCITKCNHKMCEAELNEWLKTRTTCPYCRSKISRK